MIGFVFFLIIICLCIFFKIVPNGKVVIIDRNSHYLKTRKFGIYFFFPFTDKITTEISESPCFQRYSEIFETYDSQFIRISYSVSYNTDDIDKTLKALSDSRRSIYDVINCSVYNVIKGSNYVDLQDINNILNLIEQKVKFDATSLEFIVLKINISNISRAGSGEGILQFKPHISSSSGPIKYY